jgi:enoyl-CoA hydratase/carnithine racemase
LPEAVSGLFPFIALAIAKDALPKKVLFDLIYSARLMGATEAQALHVVNETAPAPLVVERALERAAQTKAYDTKIVALGRNLYYATRGIPADDALDASERALLEALALAVHAKS